MTTSIDLVHGEDAAVISPIGASLRAFTVGGRRVVVAMEAFDGAVLAPWPNRIADGRYEFDGRALQLPITEPERNTALHGLVADVAWTIAQRSESSASLETAIAPSAGYPFSLALSVTYELDEDGLRVRARARNIGGDAAPFGFGFHPWLHPGAETADEAQLLIPAQTWYETDERLIPIALRPFDDGSLIPADHGSDPAACLMCKDFRALRSIGASVLDDAFGASRREEFRWCGQPPGEESRDGWSRARLRGGDGREIIIAMDEGFRTWQVTTGDALGPERARRAVAIEPMTCPPNAFADDADVDVLEPGDELTVEWSIRLTPP